jgi:hypothetical protein
LIYFGEERSAPDRAPRAAVVAAHSRKSIEHGCQMCVRHSGLGIPIAEPRTLALTRAHAANHHKHGILLAVALILRATERVSQLKPILAHALVQRVIDERSNGAYG